jgi:RimJ/RimL family protein N-acetyltransferase
VSSSTSVSCSPAVTFIILERDSANSSEIISHDLREGMIGDVNLFISDVDEAEDADSERKPERTNIDGANRKKGELEIMIAEPSARRKGYASQALKLMICYAMQELNLGPEDFLVKIGMDNAASIRMFENLGFSIVKRVEVFQEVEMRVVTRISQFKWLMDSEIYTHGKISIT